MPESVAEGGLTYSNWLREQIGSMRNFELGQRCSDEDGAWTGEYKVLRFNDGFFRMLHTIADRLDELEDLLRVAKEAQARKESADADS